MNVQIVDLDTMKPLSVYHPWIMLSTYQTLVMKKEEEKLGLIKNIMWLSCRVVIVCCFSLYNILFVSSCSMHYNFFRGNGWSPS